MKRLSTLWAYLIFSTVAIFAKDFPTVKETPQSGYFCLSDATIYIDAADYQVVDITANMLADDIERVTGQRPALQYWKSPPTGKGKGSRITGPKSLQRDGSLPSPFGGVGGGSRPCVVAGTLGNSRLIDGLVKSLKTDVSSIKGKWESFIVTTARHPKNQAPLLIIIGSDRRGTAYGLTSISEAIGVSPWYWWADVTPEHKKALYVEPGFFRQGEPSVQYRGIFINDERFGGWARWAEQHFDKESGKVGPKTYQKVFELLLRLKANYLWPAMHPGTQAFNDDPENARMADDYAIVMGSSHCEQMLRNNEGEWKAIEQKHPGTLGDFNYITNRKTMQNYWETRVKTNGKYENTYTLGLRGIHDYPMEGANNTQERVALMQQAINDQRDILRRNINKPLTEIPQVLCTYEEVLDAYHHGLQVPDDVTLLWSDDKHGYCRNLCNTEEMKRKGGAGIYYHLSYHGDPASWIWLSPLSPPFLSTELTKAYTFGARKIWVFNVGDIKPAEKEISFVMELAWDINKWKPAEAHNYIKYWAKKTFGPEVAQEIADMQAGYYRLQAAGKDAHVWFVDYSEEQIEQRIAQWRALSAHAMDVEKRIPESLRPAYFELISYPIRGAAMINEYQLLARRSMERGTEGDGVGAMADAGRVKTMFNELNAWTNHYNNELLNGKWAHYFNWQPYHWFRSEKIDPPYCTPELFAKTQNGPSPRFLDVSKATSAEGITVVSETDGDIPIWIEALTPVRNFSKEAKDNVFCQITSNEKSFEASATPINNVWHAHLVGPMWSCVGTIHLNKGDNRIAISHISPEARIDKVFIGLYPPFSKEPRMRIPASAYHNKRGNIYCIEGLGYTDGLLVQPFDTVMPAQDSRNQSLSQKQVNDAPYVEYELNIEEADRCIEIRSLPTLHVYEGCDARYAVQLGNNEPQVFSIHANDFSAEWRCNVLRGYASRSIGIPATCRGRQTLRITFLDPGIVLQEILQH